MSVDSIIQIIVQGTALVVGFGALYRTIRTSNRTVRRDEINDLRADIERQDNKISALSAESDRKEVRINRLISEVYRLRAENAWLRTVLIKNNIMIPELPPELKFDAPGTVDT